MLLQYIEQTWPEVGIRTGIFLAGMVACWLLAGAPLPPKKTGGPL